MKTYTIKMQFRGCPYPLKFTVSAHDEATARYQAKRAAWKIWDRGPSEIATLRCEVHP